MPYSLVMSTTEHTAKCLKCGRIRHFRTAEAAAKAGPHGRICAMRVRLAAISEAVKGFAAAQVEKARELIADGGLVPTGRPGVFRSCPATASTATSPTARCATAPPACAGGSATTSPQPASSPQPPDRSPE